MASQVQAAPREDATLSFKRFILLETAAFEQEPMADLFRVNLLGQMLDRYDELTEHGASSAACAQHVRREFADIAERMRDAGFEEIESAKGKRSSRWRPLPEAEAVEYLEQSSVYMHKQALGIGLCTSCAMPMFAAFALGYVFYGYISDPFGMFGLVGMFGMIAMGVYMIATAAKPKNEKKIKSGKFSLTNRLLFKLENLMEQVENKARRRKGKGVALIVGCVAPLFLGIGLGEALFAHTDFGAMLGLAGMFAMLGMGVYELVLGDGEKKAVNRLLKDKTEK